MEAINVVPMPEPPAKELSGGEPLKVTCQFCRRDLSGLCNAIFSPPEGEAPPTLIGVSQPLKCRFCGRYLLHRRAKKLVWEPGEAR